MANEQNLKPFTGADDPRRGTKPKGTKHLSTVIQEMLNEDVSFKTRKDPNGNEEKFTGKPIKAIVAVAIYRSMLGDKDAREWLAKHGYGNKLIIETEDPAVAALKRLGLLDAGEDQRTTSKAS